MPELPEVETLRRSLEPHLLGRRVTGVVLHRRDVVTLPGDPAGGWGRNASRRTDPMPPVRDEDLLVGARITELRRHGKHLVILAADGRALAVHLGMSGQLLALGPLALAEDPTHVHAAWRLTGPGGIGGGVAGGGRLHFRDPRRFGGLWPFPSYEALHRARLADLGPDALGVTAADLSPRLAGTARAIKAVLLDQGTLAGVGNIYADESLFLARVHPGRPAGSLEPGEVTRLAAAIREVLEAAVAARGATLRDYRDSDGAEGGAQHRFRVYGRAGQPCPECRRALHGLRLAGRATVCCLGCQGKM